MSTTFSFASQLRLAPKLVGGSFVQAPVVTATFELSDGIGAGQADAMWHQEVAVASETSTTLDLTALAVEACGLTGEVYFATVKTIYIANTSAMPSVTVFATDEENNPWAALYTVPVLLAPGGVLLAMDQGGWEVSGTSKTIKITNDETVYAITGDVTEGSKVISGIDDTSSIVVGMTVTALGIPTGATVTQKTSSTITLSAAATATTAAQGLDVTKPPAVLLVSVSGVLD